MQYALSPGSPCRPRQVKRSYVRPYFSTQRRKAAKNAEVDQISGKRVVSCISGRLGEAFAISIVHICARRSARNAFKWAGLGYCTIPIGMVSVL